MISVFRSSKCGWRCGRALVGLVDVRIQNIKTLKLYLNLRLLMYSGDSGTRAQPILGTRWGTDLAPLPGSHVDLWQQFHLIILVR